MVTPGQTKVVCDESGNLVKRQGRERDREFVKGRESEEIRKISLKQSE